MTTFYVLWSPSFQMYARAGRGTGIITSLNYAKHFTSQWSAANYKRNSNLFEDCVIKKIVLQ